MNGEGDYFNGSTVSDKLCLSDIHEIIRRAYPASYFEVSVIWEEKRWYLLSFYLREGMHREVQDLKFKVSEKIKEHQKFVKEPFEYIMLNNDSHKMWLDVRFLSS